MLTSDLIADTVGYPSSHTKLNENNTLHGLSHAPTKVTLPYILLYKVRTKPRLMTTMI
jgi:hypothetical protein